MNSANPDPQPKSPEPERAAGSPSSAAPPPVPQLSLHQRLPQWVLPCAAAAVAIVLPYAVVSWVTYRYSHSITDDAFVEAHIVNVAPEAVSGRVIRFLVDENDRVKQNQVIAEIDPIPYRDKVELAKSKVEGAEA